MTPADQLRVLAPDNFDVGQRRGPPARIQNGSRNGRAASISDAGFDIAQVDEIVFREIRMQGDVAKTPLATIIDVRRPPDGSGLLSIHGNDEEISFLFCHEHAPIGHKRKRPGFIEGSNRLDLERQIGLRLRGYDYEETQRCGDQSLHH